MTRDRREGEASLHGLDFTIIDTAGLEEADPKSLAGRMRAQTEAAVATADLTLFMIDARAGVTPLDAHFADLLHGLGKPVVLVANKAEGKAGAAGALEAYELGFGEPVAVSAEHGEGMADLHEAIIAALPEERRDARRMTSRQADPDRRDRPAECRQVDADQPDARRGAAADRPGGRHHPRFDLRRLDVARSAVPLFDTAGMRRRARVVEKLEKLAVGDGLRAIRFAEVVILVLDATSPSTSRTCRSPTWSKPRAGRSSSPSTSGT